MTGRQGAKSRTYPSIESLYNLPLHQLSCPQHSPQQHSNNTPTTPHTTNSIKMPNPNVFFDISIDGAPAGRIVMELFADQTPKVLPRRQRLRCFE
jgi:hypothetical protein